jgi:hypothetical protein
MKAKYVRYVIKEMRPNAQCSWSGRGVKDRDFTSKYWDEWEWNDPRTKPTFKEMTDCWNTIKDTVLAEELRKKKIDDKMRIIIKELAIKELTDLGEI